MRLVGISPNVEHVMRIAGLETYLGLDVPAAGPHTCAAPAPRSCCHVDELAVLVL